MSSQVEICNMAMAHARAGSILAMDEPSNEAVYCNLFYEPARKFVMEAVPWKFCNKVAALALHVDAPLQWLYSYAYPSDCLAIRRLLPDITLVGAELNDILYRLTYYGEVNYNLLYNRKIPYETAMNDVSTQAIWTNEPTAYLQYTFNQTDPTKLTSSFVVAFTHYLSTLIAVPIVGRKEGREIVRDNFGIYQATLAAAIANNEIEKYIGPARESDMITVRGGF